MKRTRSQPRTSFATTLPEILANQSDPAYMAAVAQRRHALLEGHRWAYNDKTGQWYLKKVHDGAVKTEQAA